MARKLIENNSGHHDQGRRSSYGRRLIRAGEEITELFSHFDPNFKDLFIREKRRMKFRGI